MKAVDDVGFNRDVRKAVEKNAKGRSDMTTDELIKALAETDMKERTKDNEN